MQKKGFLKLKNTAIFVSIVATSLLIVAIILSLKSSKEMRALVADQFNQQQLIIARNISSLIERELSLLKKELVLLGKDIKTNPFRTESNFARIQKAHLHIAESGVYKIEIVDCLKRETYLFIPYQHGSLKKISAAEFEDLKKTGLPESGKIWVSHPIIKSNGIHLILGVGLPADPTKQLLFNVNVSWFLAPFLKDIRSGKSGYAWIIDSNGIFLYHPESEFVGRNAFEARREKDHSLPFKLINMIQREKMIKGLEGTDGYYSGWHRGITGKIKKLIAYSPVMISENPLQKWSVAVVAPVSEIEDALKRRETWQYFLQGGIILVILLSAGVILFFMMRWSRYLENTVEEKTRDLKKSEEKYRSLVESAEDFIFTVDVDGNLQSLNSFTAHFFGGHPEDFIGKPLKNLFVDDIAEKQMKLVKHVHAYGKSVRDEFEIDVGENQIWISANFMPIKNDAGDINAILCIARDITENRNLEKQLVNTEKLASLGTLAAGVAHEVNNPLGVILGFCDLLLQKTDPNSQAFEDLKTIERQGLHCKDVVENLLSFARLEGGDYEYTDLNHCILEIIKVVNHTLEMNDIELNTEFADNLPPVKGNYQQLQQVFLNLINNAIAAMNGGGLLKIRTYLDKKIRKAVVELKDTGCGIKKEDMDRIFEPFFTTKPEGEGTGLGLFVSYGIITRYGGTIDCMSSTVSALGKQRGTTFTIKFLTEVQEDE